MASFSTRAWVLHENASDGLGLQEEDFDFGELSDNEVLISPLYGCWEANISHAIDRMPINIARRRQEPRVVLGNAGVVRVERVGDRATKFRNGDICLFYPCGRADKFGYWKLVHGYDAPGTMGLLAKLTKVPDYTLIPLPENTPYSLQQWAAFSARYTTAWSNWKMAYGTFRLHLSEEELPVPFVWGWGGGTTFAELDLARRFGCSTVMISGSPIRIQQIESAGISSLDRRNFPDLHFDPIRFEADRDFRKRYVNSEQAFLKEVRDRTGELGVSIFIDYIGEPVYRATLRALGRQGVITTAGWKAGMQLPIIRATECICRHTHIFTHGFRVTDVYEAMDYALENGWMPEVTKSYEWDEIPQLSRDFQTGQTDSYFPVFNINSA